MGKNSATDILKSAILLERRGRAFYETVARQASEPAVKEFFDQMAREEARHVEVLVSQFREVVKNGRFAAGGENTPEDLPNTVLTEALKSQIASAGFESAAVAAAMAFEERAIRLYAKQAEASEDPGEKALYRWLADWEGGHLRMLAEIDRDITERIWNDNNFWPM